LLYGIILKFIHSIIWSIHFIYTVTASVLDQTSFHLVVEVRSIKRMNCYTHYNLSLTKCITCSLSKPWFHICFPFYIHTHYETVLMWSFNLHNVMHLNVGILIRMTNSHPQDLETWTPCIQKAYDITGHLNCRMADICHNWVFTTFWIYCMGGRLDTPILKNIFLTFHTVLWEPCSSKTNNVSPTLKFSIMTDVVTLIITTITRIN
jgi:hypothetical protein